MIKDQAQAIGTRLWAQFRLFTPGQKAVTIAALAALFIGGYFFLTWKSTPPYAPLYTNLGATDASSIVDKLNSEGVPYRLAAGGTEIDVPQGSVYSTRLTMSSAGLPSGGNTGYSLLDKEGVTTSQFQQQVDYQRAIEGELQKTIESISGVAAASVHLAIPQQDVFNDGSQKPTAAVLLTLDSGAQLDSQQVQSVVYLVSSSVTGMKAGDVTVTDSSGNVLSAPGSGVTSGMAMGDQTQMRQAYDNQIQTGIQNMIDTAIGPNHATVTVNAALDFNQTQTTQRSYIYNKKLPPLSESTTKEQYKGAASPTTAAGVAGASNGTGTTSGTNGTGTSGSGNYVKSSAVVDNALGTVTSTVQTAPGQLQHLSVGVLLDKSVKGLDVAAITKLVESSVGYNQARGDQVQVTAIPWASAGTAAQTAAAAAAAKATAAAAAHARLMSMAKIGALVLLILLLVVTAFLSSRRKRSVPLEENDDILPMADDEYEPVQQATIHDLQAARSRTLVAAADQRPDDLAKALSGWLNSKEG